MSYRYWTTEEEAYLRQHYGVKRVAEIMLVLNRSQRSVEKKADKLGLRSKYPGSPLYANGGEHAPRYYGEDHPLWREPGKPWESAGRVYYRRDADSKPELYARYLMEQAGHDLTNKVVRYRDGNPLNCEPDNLMVVTRAEHARMNYRSCKDIPLRRARSRMAQTGESLVDLILKGEFV
ncbi:MAG: HNH endonuclease [Bacteroidetes bacterium]|nr:MAG: HNH endonuclease [Bacteroidota bacterium]